MYTELRQFMNVLEILKNWDKDLVLRMVLSLNKDGIISDEEHNGLSSTMVENWMDDCDAFLRNKGYEGGKLETCSRYFNACGQIYALYDSTALSAEDADRHLILLSKRCAP